MDIVYNYKKQRKQFGRHVQLEKMQAQSLIDETPDMERFAPFFIENTKCEIGVQNVPDHSCHEFATNQIQMVPHLLNNRQQPEDSESVARLAAQRKKMEREVAYVDTIKRHVDKLNPNLITNNAQDINQQYFTGKLDLNQSEPQSLRVMAVFKDPEVVKRPITQVVFQPETNRTPRRFFVSYGRAVNQEILLNAQETIKSQNPDFIQPDHQLVSSCNAAIFNIDNPNEPEQVIYSQVPITCMRFSQKDNNMLICGLESGQVAVYDLKKSPLPEVSEIQYSHRSAVAQLKLIRSKTASEFATVGADGQIIFWDLRDLVKDQPWRPKEFHKTVFKSGAEEILFPLTSLSVDNKVLTGAQSGHIFPKDGKQTIVAHHGAVRQMHRLPTAGKYYATCGDWTIKFFYDDIKTSLMMFQADSQYIDFQVSSTRASVFFGIRENGFLDIYDLFKNLQKPVMSQQIFNTSPCTCMDLDSTGKYCLIATKDGLVGFVQFSENLCRNPSQAQDKYEKQWLQLLLDREYAREKFLEQRQINAHGKKPEQPPDEQVDATITDDIKTRFDDLFSIKHVEEAVKK